MLPILMKIVSNWLVVYYSANNMVLLTEMYTKTLKDFAVIFFILTLEQIMVLNKYCTYNKPISKISLKTLK